MIDAIRVEFANHREALELSIKHSLEACVHQLRTQIQPQQSTSDESNIDKDDTYLFRSLQQPPRFTGEDPHVWCSKIEEYFNFHNTSAENRLNIVALYLEYDVYVWYRRTQANGMFRDWNDFLEKIKERFGPSKFVDFHEKFESQVFSSPSFILEAASISVPALIGNSNPITGELLPSCAISFPHTIKTELPEQDLLVKSHSYLPTLPRPIIVHDFVVGEVAIDIIKPSFLSTFDKLAMEQAVYFDPCVTTHFNSMGNCNGVGLDIVNINKLFYGYDTLVRFEEALVVCKEIEDYVIKPYVVPHDRFLVFFGDVNELLDPDPPDHLDKILKHSCSLRVLTFLLLYLFFKLPP
ncbi:hypothetical protein M5689_002514 [Euphorbia peplus]|nr:hypothetical protein M5689_002514 [Euphorbia peplus]